MADPVDTTEMSNVNDGLHESKNDLWTWMDEVEKKIARMNGDGLCWLEQKLKLKPDEMRLMGQAQRLVNLVSFGKMVTGKKQRAKARARVTEAVGLLSGNNQARMHLSEVRKVTKRAFEESVSSGPSAAEPRDQLLPPPPPSPDEYKLVDITESPRKCYVCRQLSKKMHGYYSSMCQSCGEHSLRLLHMRADLAGQVAIVTGARLKIGFATALRLLRFGATVIATSRFATAAQQAYSLEQDYASFKSRLHILPLDLMSAESRQVFVKFVKTHFPTVHILINNAAQTLHRPPVFYKEPLRIEQVAASFSNSSLTTLAIPANSSLSSSSSQTSDAQHPIIKLQTSALAPYNNVQTLALAVAQNTQRIICPEDKVSEKEAAQYFPEGKVDEYGQQRDLRPVNSWVKGVEQISEQEMAQVFMVNVVGPTILTKELLPELLNGASEQTPHFVVQVSAMEGSFAKSHKTPNHPHTNMAKAALNMFVRTEGAELASKGVYMTSCDTGWVNNMLPDDDAVYIDEKDQKLHQLRKDRAAEKKQSANAFVPPLNDEDAAARVLYPILAFYNTPSTLHYGVFLKDGKVAPW